LHVRRAERRLSQRRIAQIAGISYDRYWRIENGYAEPTTDERTMLAAALGTTVEELFPAGSSSEAVPR
jgi:transcriptional regulator with XRE-family HTH domain